MPGKTGLHYCYKIREIHSGEILTDHLEIHFLRIPNRLGDDLSQLNNPLLADWLTFFNGSRETKEQVMEMAERTEALKPAVDAWTFFNSNEGLRALAMGRLKARRLFDNELAAEARRADLANERADLANEKAERIAQEKAAEARRADLANERADLANEKAERIAQEKAAEAEKHRVEMEGVLSYFRNLLPSMLENRIAGKDFQVIRERIAEISNLKLLQHLAAKSKEITDIETFDAAIRDFND